MVVGVKVREVGFGFGAPLIAGSDSSVPQHIPRVSQSSSANPAVPSAFRAISLSYVELLSSAGLKRSPCGALKTLQEWDHRGGMNQFALK